MPTHTAFKAAAYERALREARHLYKQIGWVHSPIFGTKVRFSAEGFNHLIYKKGRLERPKSDQMLRLRLLRLAPHLVELATTYQEYEENTTDFQAKTEKKPHLKQKPIRYWSLIAIIENTKFKVIIRKIGDNGVPHFWSVIPNWKTSWHRDIKFQSTMDGNPEED